MSQSKPIAFRKSYHWNDPSQATPARTVPAGKPVLDDRLETSIVPPHAATANAVSNVVGVRITRLPMSVNRH